MGLDSKALLAQVEGYALELCTIVECIVHDGINGCGDGNRGDAGACKGVSADGFALQSGAITHSQTSRLETVVYGAGVPYTMIAVKYVQQTDKERIADFVGRLTGSGSVTLNKAKVNASFTDSQWAALIATKPNWTFSWI